jgi:hypothetical protein
MRLERKLRVTELDGRLTQAEKVIIHNMSYSNEMADSRENGYGHGATNQELPEKTTLPSKTELTGRIVADIPSQSQDQNRTKSVDVPAWPQNVAGAIEGAGSGALTSWMKGLDKANGFALEDGRAERLYRQNEFKPAIEGALKGAGAALAVTAFDRGLQAIFGQNILGHDLFAPTDIEAAAAGFAANSKGNYSLGIGIGVIGWIGGRVQNFYQK